MAIPSKYTNNVERAKLTYLRAYWFWIFYLQSKVFCNKISRKEEKEKHPSKFDW